MSFLLIICLFWRSCKNLSKIFESFGAPERIKMEIGTIVFSFRTTVTLNPIKWPLVVENPHFKFSFSRCFGMKCLSLLKSQADGVASTIKRLYVTLFCLLNLIRVEFTILQYYSAEYLLLNS